MNKEITFYRSVKSMSGKPYDSIVWSIEIPFSIPEDQAIKLAKEELCKWAKVDNWIDIADSCATSLGKDLEVKPKTVTETLVSPWKQYIA